MIASIPATALDELLVHTVYRTEEGREAIVVFTGPEQAFEFELAPVHDGAGGVRIGYLPADGSCPDSRTCEYAFYTGALTPVRWLRPPTTVLFKHKDEDDGEPVGPMGFFFEGEDPHRLRPFDPDRKRSPWVTRSHATQFADSVGLTVQES